MIIERDGYCVWSYQRPLRGTTITEWAYALRSSDGLSWEIGRAHNGFDTQEMAEKDAQWLLSALTNLEECGND